MLFYLCFLFVCFVCVLSFSGDLVSGSGGIYLLWIRYKEANPLLTGLEADYLANNLPRAILTCSNDQLRNTCV